MSELDGLNTVDSILDKLEEIAREKTPIRPVTWIDGAIKLIALSGDEHDRLITLHSEVSKAKAGYMEQGQTASYAKVKVEASEKFKEYCLQKAKIDRVNEMIRISKVRGRLAQDEMESWRRQ